MSFISMLGICCCEDCYCPGGPSTLAVDFERTNPGSGATGSGTLDFYADEGIYDLGPGFEETFINACSWVGVLTLDLEGGGTDDALCFIIGSAGPASASCEFFAEVTGYSTTLYIVSPPDPLTSPAGLTFEEDEGGGIYRRLEVA